MFCFFLNYGHINVFQYSVDTQADWFVKNYVQRVYFRHTRVFIRKQTQYTSVKTSVRRPFTPLNDSFSETPEPIFFKIWDPSIKGGQILLNGQGPLIKMAAWGWSGGAKTSFILCHRGIQLILAYNWARPAILVVGKEGGCFYCPQPFRRKARGHGIRLCVVRDAWRVISSRYLVSSTPLQFWTDPFETLHGQKIRICFCTESLNWFFFYFFHI